MGNKKKHPLFSTWRNMVRRCHSETNPKYLYYGQRGIGVHPQWREDFWSFADYMGERPAGHTLDRIDNDGSYEPGNVRWATYAEQANNRRPRGSVLPANNQSRWTGYYRAADCHPEQRHDAQGLCSSCYRKQRYYIRKIYRAWSTIDDYIDRVGA